MEILKEINRNLKPLQIPPLDLHRNHPLWVWDTHLCAARPEELVLIFHAYFTVIKLL